ncbi:hypothetical protein C0991_009921 [Blastosporella zonata]|nr:hypothetical protein C0991_009921 [Blastosporella zonata]
MNLMQEHFNRWLEEMAQHKGKEFEDQFYRKVLSPHVHHFINLKDEIENMVSLQPRTKKHTLPNYDRELTSLMNTVRNEELNCQRDGRFEGHCTRDAAAEGLEVLQNGKVDSFIKKSIVDSTMSKLRAEKMVQQEDLVGLEDLDLMGLENETDAAALNSDPVPCTHALANVTCIENEYFMEDQNGDCK